MNLGSGDLVIVGQRQTEGHRKDCGCSTCRTVTIGIFPFCKNCSFWKHFLGHIGDCTNPASLAFKSTKWPQQSCDAFSAVAR